MLADGLDGKIKTGDPLSSSFPIRSSVRCNALCSRRARSEECVRAYDLAVPLLLRHRGELDHGDRTSRAVVKSTFVESKTSPSPKRFESESSPSPKRFESESSPSPKRFKSKSKGDGQNRERKKSSSKPHT